MSEIVFYSIGVEHPIAPDEPLPPLPQIPRGALVVIVIVIEMIRDWVLLWLRLIVPSTEKDRLWTSHPKLLALSSERNCSI